MDKSTVRIVVLDDEPLMLSLIAFVLRNLGFSNIVECDNGPAALEVVDGAAPPEVILLDLNMPGMDGMAFVRHLVERNYAGNLVLVSGEDAKVLHVVETLIRAHRMSVIGHIEKPFNRETMDAVMERALRSLQQPPPAQKRYDADALRSALEEGQLVNFYQPVVEVPTAALIGVETLVRWRHPEDGLVYPDQFIALAEQHGLIDSLSRLVLRNALDQARRWRDAGIPLRIAINLSIENLLSTEFVDFILQEAARADIAPSDIALEVIQNRLMQDLRVPLEALARLRMKRFRLTIDDFGTGHATLRQLQDIPFDELKIDRGFVHGASKDPSSRAIYDASMTLGKQMGMTVVAEGVETRLDWEMLKQTQCDFAQGYFIGRPMSAEDLTHWMDEWPVRRHSVLGSGRSAS
jgi:EAL domain-containing protein (putative c-di-GMP-specific phosphodiesterase class I)/ActR/RegA family two-component response regulator